MAVRVETFTVMVKGDGRQHQQQSFWDPHGTRGGEIFGSEQGRRLN